MPLLCYSSGYKLQTKSSFTENLGLHLTKDMITTNYISLAPDGVIYIREGYAWDGPSFPAIHTKNFMRGSLIHDALYQLIREEYLPKHCKSDADTLLNFMCKLDGMFALRAYWVYWGVRLFGHNAIKKSSIRKVKIAP